ncbi:MAG: site-2 protease family protein [Blautia marasmi]
MSPRGLSMVHQRWGRIATVAAGPVFNFILAFVFAVLIVTLVGYDPAEVTQVESGSTVAEAGLREGDIIKEYRGIILIWQEIFICICI